MEVFKPKNYPIHRLMDMSQELIWLDNETRVELKIPYLSPDYITVIEVPHDLSPVYSVYELGNGVRDLSAYPQPEWRWVGAKSIELKKPYTGWLQILRRTDIVSDMALGLNPAYTRALHITQEILGSPQKVRPVIKDRLIITHNWTIAWLKTQRSWLVQTQDLPEREVILKLRRAWEDMLNQIQEQNPEVTIEHQYPALALGVFHDAAQENLPDGYSITEYVPFNPNLDYSVNNAWSAATVTVKLQSTFESRYDLKRIHKSSTGWYYRIAGSIETRTARPDTLSYMLVWKDTSVMYLSAESFHEPVDLVLEPPVYPVLAPSYSPAANTPSEASLVSWMYWVPASPSSLDYAGHWKHTHYTPRLSIRMAYKIGQRVTALSTSRVQWFVIPNPKADAMPKELSVYKHYGVTYPRTDYDLYLQAEVYSREEEAGLTPQELESYEGGNIPSRASTWSEATQPNYPSIRGGWAFSVRTDPRFTSASLVTLTTTDPYARQGFRLEWISKPPETLQAVQIGTVLSPPSLDYVRHIPDNDLSLNTGGYKFESDAQVHLTLGLDNTGTAFPQEIETDFWASRQHWLDPSQQIPHPYVMHYSIYADPSTAFPLYMYSVGFNGLVSVQLNDIASNYRSTKYTDKVIVWNT